MPLQLPLKRLHQLHNLLQNCFLFILIHGLLNKISNYQKEIVHYEPMLRIFEIQNNGQKWKISIMLRIAISQDHIQIPSFNIETICGKHFLTKGCNPNTLGCTPTPVVSVVFFFFPFFSEKGYPTKLLGQVYSITLPFSTTLHLH